jgi:hypothetical protein
MLGTIGEPRFEGCRVVVTTTLVARSRKIAFERSFKSAGKFQRFLLSKGPERVRARVRARVRGVYTPLRPSAREPAKFGRAASKPHTPWQAVARER